MSDVLFAGVMSVFKGNEAMEDLVADNLKKQWYTPLEDEQIFIIIKKKKTKKNIFYLLFLVR